MLEVMTNALTLFLFWLFARAALHKFRYATHYRQLVSSFLEGHGRTLPLVYLIAAVELGLALLVIPPATRALGFTGVSLLLAFYAALMAWHYLRGHVDLRCGCSGIDSQLTVGPALIARNLVCCAFALTAIAAPGAWPQNLLLAGCAVLVALALVAAYQLSDDLIAQAQAMEQDI